MFGDLKEEEEGEAKGSGMSTICQLFELSIIFCIFSDSASRKFSLIELRLLPKTKPGGYLFKKLVFQGVFFFKNFSLKSTIVK